ncbi:MAG TPA: T9SS type A sorting domain-containing protein, partial [Cryomorphaceae bacterium]|nr:T9SS type A sorting domain-containing protein [Cryomorphaceae bacterium]
ANGTVVAIGAPRNSGNGIFAGHVRIYQNIAGMWTQVGSDIDGEAGSDFSGYSVSLSEDGNVVAIGAPSNDGNDSFAGHVRVYENNSNNWVQVGSDIDGQELMDESGWSVSLSADGKTVAIGAPRHSDSGRVQVYQEIAGNWILAGSDIVGEAPGDYSGWSVSISVDGTKVAIGAPHNTANGFHGGHVRVFDLSTVLSSDQFVKANFKIYPNPATEYVNVQLSEDLQLERVNVYSAAGQLIKTERKQVVSVNELAKGTYIVEVITDQGKAGKLVVVE